MRALYLLHSFHILGISKSFSLLLSVIVNEQLVYDKDVKRLIILLARAIEPRNADQYIDTLGSGFKNATFYIKKNQISSIKK
jgi:hypothetical protein